MVEVIVPSSGHRLRIPAEDLVDLSQRRWQGSEIVWRAAATPALALAADGDPLVSARRGVTLLPHQLATLERALAMDPVHLAICDVSSERLASLVLPQPDARLRILIRVEQ